MDPFNGLCHKELRKGNAKESNLEEKLSRT